MENCIALPLPLRQSHAHTANTIDAPLRLRHGGWVSLDCLLCCLSRRVGRNMISISGHPFHLSPFWTYMGDPNYSVSSAPGSWAPSHRPLLHSPTSFSSPLCTMVHATRLSFVLRASCLFIFFRCFPLVGPAFGSDIVSSCSVQPGLYGGPL